MSRVLPAYDSLELPQLLAEHPSDRIFRLCTLIDLRHNHSERQVEFQVVRQVSSVKRQVANGDAPNFVPDQFPKSDADA